MQKRSGLLSMLSVGVCLFLLGCGPSVPTTCPQGQVLKDNVCVAAPKAILGAISGKVTLKGLTKHAEIKIVLLGLVNKSVQAKEDGTYEFKDLKPGQYTIRAEAPSTMEGAVGTSVIVPQKEEAVKAADLELSPVGILAGKANKDGETDHSGILAILVDTSLVGSSGADGDFRIRNVPIGTYTLKLAATGFTTGEIKDLKVEYNKTVNVGKTTLKGQVVSNNKPPVFISKPALEAFEGKSYEYTVEAKDPEGKKVTLQLVGFPKGMKFDAGGGKLSWTPGAEQDGVHTVALSAKDEDGNEAFQIFTITVQASWTIFNTTKGLPSNNVHSITEAKDGSVWFATNNGVARWADNKFTIVTDSTLAEKLQGRSAKILSGGEVTRSKSLGGLLSKASYPSGKVGTAPSNPNLGKVDTFTLSGAVFDSATALEGGVIDSVVDKTYNGKLNTWTPPVAGKGLTFSLNSTKMPSKPTPATGFATGKVTSWDSVGTTMTDSTATFPSSEGLKGKYLASSSYSYSYSRHYITTNTNNTLKISSTNRTGYFPPGRVYWTIDGSSYFYWTFLASGIQTGQSVCFFKANSTLIECMSVTNVSGFNVTVRAYRASETIITGMTNEADSYAIADTSGYFSVVYKVSTSLTPGALKGQRAYFAYNGRTFDVTDNTSNEMTLKVRSSDLRYLRPNDDFAIVDSSGYVTLTVTAAGANWTPDQYKGKYLYVYNSRAFSIAGNTSNTLTVKVSSYDYGRYVTNYWKSGADYWLLNTSSTSSAFAKLKFKSVNFTKGALNGRYMHVDQSTSSYSYLRVSDNDADTVTIQASPQDIDRYIKVGSNVLFNSSSYYRTAGTRASLVFTGVSWAKDQWLGYTIGNLSSGSATESGGTNINLTLSPYDLFRILKGQDNTVKKGNNLLFLKGGRAEGVLKAQSGGWTTDEFAGRSVLLDRVRLTIAKNTSDTLIFSMGSSDAQVFAQSSPAKGSPFLFSDKTTGSFLAILGLSGVTITADEFKGGYVWDISSNPNRYSIRANGTDNLSIEISNANEAVTLPYGPGVGVIFSKSNNVEATFTDSQSSYTKDTYLGRRLHYNTENTSGSYTIKSHDDKNFVIDIDGGRLGQLMDELGSPFQMRYFIGRDDDKGFDLTFESKEKLVKDSLKGQSLRLFTRKGLYIASYTVDANDENGFTVIASASTSLEKLFATVDPLTFFNQNQGFVVEITLGGIPQATQVAGLYLEGEQVTQGKGNRVVVSGSSSSLPSGILTKIVNNQDLSLEGHMRLSGTHNVVAAGGGDVYMLTDEGLNVFKNSRWTAALDRFTSGSIGDVTQLAKPIVLAGSELSIGNCLYQIRAGKTWTPNQFAGAVIEEMGGNRSYTHTVIRNDETTLTFYACSLYTSSPRVWTLHPLSFKPGTAPAQTPEIGDLINVNGTEFVFAGTERGNFRISPWDIRRYWGASAPSYGVSDGGTFSTSQFHGGTYTSSVPAAMAIDPRGNLWAAGRGGFYSYTGGKFKMYETRAVAALVNGTIDDVKYHSIQFKSANWQNNQYKDHYLLIGSCTFKIDNNNKNWLTISSDSIHSSRSCAAIPGRSFSIVTEEINRLSSSVSAIAAGIGDELWVAAGQGLLQKDGARWKAWTSENTESSKGKRDGLPSCTIYSLIATGAEVWVGTSCGLVVHNKKAQTWKLWTRGTTESKPGLNDGLISDRIYALARTSEGIVWIGTSEGISVYSALDKTWKQYRSDFEGGTYRGLGNSPLPDNRIYNITVDSKGAIWVATPRGGAYFNPNKK